jgi:hypothetical protein
MWFIRGVKQMLLGGMFAEGRPVRHALSYTGCFGRPSTLQSSFVHELARRGCSRANTHFILLQHVKSVLKAAPLKQKEQVEMILIRVPCNLP